jgi:hypothetical protein
MDDDATAAAHQGFSLDLDVDLLPPPPPDASDGVDATESPDEGEEADVVHVRARLLTARLRHD